MMSEKIRQNFIATLKVSFFIYCLFVGFYEVKAQTTSNPDKAKQRLEELFMWKVSDSLELSAEQESKFTQAFKELNEKKSKSGDKLDKTLVQIEKASTNAEIKSHLAAYQKELKTYNQISIEEIEVMKKILGEKKLAQYLVLKRDLNQKLKNLLSSPSRPIASQPKEE